jgi:hypothetical protein
MDLLPQELVDSIVSFLRYSELSDVLTLTKKLQYAAERKSGVFEKFTIDQSSSKKFLALYSGRRLSYLRKVKFRPVLSTIELWEDEESKLSCR